MRIAVLISWFFLLLIACGDPPVTFTEPMPVNGKVLDRFPKKYQGVYINKTDGSRLYINDLGIVREYDYILKLHRDSLESGDSLSNDTIFHLSSGEYDVVAIQGDYLTQNIHWFDTLFVVSDYPLLRKYKGYLFLNTDYQYGYEVHQVKLKKGVLEINSISTTEEIEMLNEFEENDSDTIASPYSPTKREFRKFIKSEGFQSGEQFVKIK